MIYQIKTEENIIYDIREEEFETEDPILNLEIGKIGTLNFTIYPDHPYFNTLKRLMTRVEVLKNGKTIFRGRIVSDEQTIYNSKNIECESALAYLNDSIVLPGQFKGSPNEFLEFIINNHNSQVTESQKLKLGHITVEDNNDYISRSWEKHQSSLNLLNERGVELLGGYIVERYEKDGTYIDWLGDFDKTCSQEIELGENLIDLFTRNDSSETYSVVYPIGAEIENEDGTKERIGISSVNDDKDYLVDDQALAMFGWRVAPISDTTFDDVTIPYNLKRKGEEYLNKIAKLTNSSIELTALDLNLINASIEDLFICKYIRFRSIIHNIDVVLLLKKITIQLAHPENTIIEVGDTKQTFTGIELGGQKELNGVIERVGYIEADYVKNKDVTEIVNESITNSSIIKQIPEKITMEVSEQTTIIKQDVDTNLSDINASLNEINTNLNNNFSDNSKLDQVLETNKSELIELFKTMFDQTNNAFKFEIMQELNKDGVLTLKNNMVVIDAEGIKVAVNTNDFNTFLNNLGLYMRDGTTIVSYIDKDGLYSHNIKNDGKYERSYTITEDIIDENGEECEATFWKG